MANTFVKKGVTAPRNPPIDADGVQELRASEDGALHLLNPDGSHTQASVTPAQLSQALAENPKSAATIVQDTNNRMLSDAQIQLFTASVQGRVPKGGWNVATNSPSVVATLVSVGDSLIVTTAGSSSVPTGSTIAYELGDQLVKTTAGIIVDKAAKLPGDKTVTPAKTTFVGPGKNLFNKADPGNVALKYISSLDGLPNTHASYTASHYIEVVVGQWYRPTFKNQLAFYNSAKVYVSGLDSGRTNTQFQVPTDVAYVRLSVDNINTFQLEIGQVATAYAAFIPKLAGVQVDATDVILADDKQFVTLTEKTAFAAKLGPDAVVTGLGKNLFNKANGKDGFYLNLGVETANAAYGYGQDYIAVSAGLTYTAWGGTQGARFITYYNSSKVYVSSVTSTTKTFTIPDGIAFMRCTYFVGEKATFQVEQNSTNTAYEAFQLILKQLAGADVKMAAADLVQDTTHRLVTDAKQAIWDGKVDGSAVVAIPSKNLFDLSKGTDGYTLNTDGSLQANASYGYSDYIPVIPAAVYTGTGAASVMRRIHYYNSSKVFQSFVDNPTNPVTIPAGIAFTRVSYYVSEKATFQFELGTVRTAYAAFTPTLESVAGAKVPTNTSSANIVLPAKLYAVVGKEFNLYYDSFTLLGEYGSGTPNFLFEIICSKGQMSYRSFRFTPASGDVGSYLFTFNLLDGKGNIIETASSQLVVVAAANPASVKHVLHFGDSTIDEGTTSQTLQANLQAIGGNVPVFHGQHHPAPYKNEARTGRMFANFAGAAGSTAYKFFVSGVPTNLDLTNIRNTYYYHGTSGNQVLLSERWNIAGDGTGWIIGYYFSAFTMPVSFPTTLVASIAPGFPSTITVTSAQTLSNFSIFKDSDGVGALNISFYRQTVLGMASGTKFDAVAIDLGLNDVSTGSVLTDAQATAIIDNAKLLVAAFLADNAACKIVISLPKSHSSDFFITSRKQSVYRISIHKLRKALIATFDFNATYPNVFISQSGYSIDRFYGYPNAAQAPAARISTPTFLGTTDDVHPNTGGYQQVADGLTGCFLTVLQ
jgi:lysophospholipase L1-like esterase